MNKEELLKEISSTMFKVKVEKLSTLSSKDEFLVSDLLELCFYFRKEIAFRAAWILEHIVVQTQERFLPVLDIFLEGYSKQRNPSCQRHYTKILMHLTDKNAKKVYQNKLSAFDLESVIETTFEWLIDPKTPIAVQANCMEILLNLKGKYDWINDELKAQIEFLLKDGGSAIQSRGKKILKMLAS